MNEFYEFVVRSHYRHEAYHDVSGWEVEMVYTGKEFMSFHDKNQIHNDAVSMMGTIIDGLKASSNPSGKVERAGNIMRLVDWYSIGD